MSTTSYDQLRTLAGLISDEDRRNATRVPGIGDLPVLGRLFSSTNDTTTKTEIVLLITPRLMRTIARPDARTVEFAAVVDWSSIPSNLIVDARWYDSFGSIEGQVGPGTAADLANDTVIPVEVPQGYHYVLPGRYTFVVERLSDGVPVEVLGRRFVVVDRS